MRWLIFGLGIVVGAICALAASMYKLTHRVAVEHQIIFPDKSFYNGKQFGIVSVAGTLTGPGVGSPNNTINIACYQDRKECIVTTISQIANYQIGQIVGPTMYPIVKWDATEIVAQDKPNAISCAQVTITIELNKESVLWEQEPINQTQTICKASDMRVYKWTVEASPGWKRNFGKK
jgi:hypothetical protein